MRFLRKSGARFARGSGLAKVRSNQRCFGGIMQRLIEFMTVIVVVALLAACGPRGSGSSAHQIKAVAMFADSPTDDACAGSFTINAAGYTGDLEIGDFGGGNLGGSVNYGAGAGLEALSSVSCSISAGTISFVRSTTGETYSGHLVFLPVSTLVVGMGGTGHDPNGATFTWEAVRGLYSSNPPPPPAGPASSMCSNNPAATQVQIDSVACNSVFPMVISNPSVGWSFTEMLNLPGHSAAYPAYGTPEYIFQGIGALKCGSGNVAFTLALGNRMESFYGTYSLVTGGTIITFSGNYTDTNYPGIGLVWNGNISGVSIPLPPVCPVVEPLTIIAASPTVVVGGGDQFTVSGGVPPYSFSLDGEIAGSGVSIDPNTGLLTVASRITGGVPIYVMVTDSTGAWVETSVHTLLAELTIFLDQSLLGVPVLAGSTAILDAEEGPGSPPFTWSIVSGGGSIDPATGVFIAPATPGMRRCRCRMPWAIRRASRLRSVHRLQ
jgi:hypothetical protein